MEPQDETAWLRAKRKLVGCLTATDKLQDKGESAAARRRAHNEGMRSDTSTKKKQAQQQGQWVLSAAELATVKRIAGIVPTQRTTAETHELLGVLRSSEFFLPLDEATTMAMAGALTWQQYDQDELVFAEKSVGDSFYLVVTGTLTVLMRDRDDKDTICSAAELYPGDSFGEASFLDLKKRTVSVCALEATAALRVQRDDYLSSLKTWHNAQLQRKLELLHSAPLLASENKKALRPWAERLQEETMPKGTRVIVQGQEAKRMYIIVQGECKVFREITPPGGEAQTLQVATLGPRDIFGEQGVLLDVPHTATVVAQSEVRLLSLHKVDLLSVGDAAVVERLGHAARDYPSDAEVLKLCHTGEHWRSYKDALITGVLDRKRSRKWSSGARPGQPERDEVLCRPRGYAIPAAVRAEYLIAADSFSTPVLMQDLTDVVVKLERRVELRHAGRDPQLAQYLSTRPGGEHWHGNERLRAYVRREAERHAAPSPSPSALRSRRGRRPPRGGLGPLPPRGLTAPDAGGLATPEPSSGSFPGGGGGVGGGYSHSSSNPLRRNLEELRRARDPRHAGLVGSASVPLLPTGIHGTCAAGPSLSASMSQASLLEQSRGAIPKDARKSSKQLVRGASRRLPEMAAQSSKMMARGGVAKAGPTH